METINFYPDTKNLDVFANFEVQDKSKNIIKVIGVGGGGGNAVSNMMNQGIENVTFAVVNTDSQVLEKTIVPIKVQIGDSGLGCGGVPEKGREAAEFSIDKIKNLLNDGTKMVFITAGMGGGTGTGASPVIARVAREMGILTVGVVTLPFSFEMRERIDKALEGAKMLKDNVDSLLVINNERLMEIYDDCQTTVDEALHKSDEVVTVATKSIAEIITIEGKINRDFCDVQTVLEQGGSALMSSGRAAGEHRIVTAMKHALESPLLNNTEIQKSQRLLYIVYQSHQNQVLITELNEIKVFMNRMMPHIEVLWGLYWDDSLVDEVRVDIVATGFDRERTEAANNDEKTNMINLLFEHYYNTKRTNDLVDQMNIDDGTKILLYPDTTETKESASIDNTETPENKNETEADTKNAAVSDTTANEDTADVEVGDSTTIVDAADENKNAYEPQTAEEAYKAMLASQALINGSKRSPKEQKTTWFNKIKKKLLEIIDEDVN